jgi:hypothetical protein
MKKLLRSELFWSLMLITALTALAYLPLLPQLGLIKEDWYLLWAGDKQGVSGIIASFQTDRPMAGYVYAIFYPLLGNAPLGWHIASFLLRLGGAYTFFWLVRLLWPQQKMLTTAAAALFTVYPGYLQQPNAVNKMFWHTAWFTSLLSLALTVYAVRARQLVARVMATAGALVLACIYPLIIESYIGLEAVRVLLIAYAVRLEHPGSLRETIWRTARIYLPYLLVIGGVLFWRVFLFESARPATDLGRLLRSYTETPLHMAGRITIESVRDFLEATLLAWIVPFYQLLYDGSFEQLLIAGGLGVLAGGLLYLFIRRGTTAGIFAPAPDSSTSLARDWLVIGGLAVLLGMLPVIFAGRQIFFNPTTREDHYTHQLILGAVLFLLGLLLLSLKARSLPLFMSLLVGTAVFTHYQNTARVRDFWEIQKAVWWQLTWRAPQLDDNTLLFINLPGNFAIEEGYEVWAPANFIYAPDSDRVTITGEVLDRFTAQDIFRGQRSPRTMRSFFINRRFDQSLILSMPTTRSCLHVIDGSNPQLAPEEDPLVRSVAPYSKISEVLTGAQQAVPPAEIFGPEPEHGWCYYYQKAQLARQDQNWQAVADLAAQVQNLELQPGDRTEWLPFLEGAVFSGDLNLAEKIASERIKQRDTLEYLCTQLQLNQAAYPPEAFTTLASLVCLGN